MKYRIVHADNLECLEKQINEHLEEGWALQGGICLSQPVVKNERDGWNEIHSAYAQAMVKEEGSIEIISPGLTEEEARSIGLTTENGWKKT